MLLLMMMIFQVLQLLQLLSESFLFSARRLHLNLILLAFLRRSDEDNVVCIDLVWTVLFLLFSSPFQSHTFCLPVTF